jgi:dipeptidyl aminopeptidase/acylaminoacyl peptidase
MVRPVRATGAWKAGLAITVVAAGLLWHILACIESPMAFSPNGKDLAFVTMEPYGTGDDLNLAGTHVYRLMVLSEGKPPRVLEETTQYMLSAPAWSPDGRRLAYLRMLLPDRPQRDRIKERIEKNKGLSKEMSEATSESAWAEVPLPPAAPGATEPPAKAPESTEDVSLPAAEAMVNWAEQHLSLPVAPAVLVVRDAAGGQVLSATRTFTAPMDYEAVKFLFSYLTLRPQFSPDGHLVYFCNGGEVLSVNPEENKQWVVAALAEIAAFSPDGATIAVLQNGALGLLRPKDDVTVYRRLGGDNASLSGLAWADKDTVALFRAKKDGEDNARIDFFRADGTPAKSLPLKLPPHESKDTNEGELAIAPDGAHMVLGFAADVFFLKRDGTILRHWHSEKEWLAQPTFTPDSKQVAFKLMVSVAPEGKEPDHTAAIAFFSPDGKELRRAEVPAAKLPAPPAEKEPAAKTPEEKSPADK